MYTNNNQFKNALCEYCADPAKIIRRIKAPYWPFQTVSLKTYCYECYQEIVKGKLPKVTDSTIRSRKGRNIKKRDRLQDS